MTRDLPPGLNDQMEAATNEASGIFFQTVHSAPGEVFMRSDDKSAEILRIIANDALYLCHHVKQSGPQPTFVRWDKRALGCRACIYTSNGLPDAVPRDCCDRCELPTARMRKAAVQIGFVMLFLYVCERCSDEVGGGGTPLLESPPGRAS